ncbi:MAG: DNA polymerase [Candidatus Thermoplasmatota archaeon]|nr:DNA polymerase [Candidatus Thermoplasmatota archaeon]
MKKLNSIKGKPLKFAVFDIETYKWINPYALGFYDGETYRIFTGKNCVYDFVRFVITHKYRAYTIFAHFGGKFDFNFIAETIKSLDYDFKMIFQGSSCLQIKVYHHKEGKTEGRDIRDKTCFNDSYALLKFSLDKLTKNFNVEHQKINFMPDGKKDNDYDYLYEKLFKNDDKRFHDYLRNDVLGLYEVIYKFNEMIEKNDGTMGLTIASTSLRTYQKGFLKHDITVCDKELNDEMKRAYYGGRTEILKMLLPDDKYYCYDVNSLYPYVMFNNEFPISKPMKLSNPTKRNILNDCGITYCKIVAPDLYIPLLPLHYSINKINKLIYPVGEFYGYWDNHFLRKALELGYKIEIKKMYIFKTDYIFKDFVKKFFEIKQKAKKDSPDYVLAKLMLNSLYGKFAQNQESEVFMKIKNIDDLKNYDIIDCLDADFNIFRVKTESKGNFFIPQISIHVTTLSQLHLFDYLSNIYKKDCVLGYYDTDSLFTNARLNTSDKLGDLKIEYTFKRGYFLLPKTYCIIKNDNQEYVKAKGFSNELQKKLTKNIFENALFRKDYSGFELQTKDLKVNGMLSSYVRHKNFVSVDYVKRSIKTFYDKRIILKNFDTEPLRIIGQDLYI